MTDLIPGIYKISSITHPDRIYIGSAVDLSKRWNNHLHGLHNRKHYNTKLQRHFNKYGKGDMIFSVIYVCEKHELIEAEQYFIDSYKPFFNVSKVAGSNLGMKMSASAIEKNRLARIGKKIGPASEARKRKIKEWNTGRKMTDEDRKKMSLARIGKSPWNKGTHGLYSEEYKAKLREKRRSFKHTEESKRKISEAHKGHVAYNLGMPAWNKGLEMSEESRKKMSKAKKGKSPWNKGKKFVNGRYIDKDAA